MLSIVKLAWSVLGFIIPVPVGVILVLSGWLYFDRNSAVREAVNKATTELVAGAELRAAEAKFKAQKQLTDDANEHARLMEERQKDLQVLMDEFRRRSMAQQGLNKVLDIEIRKLKENSHVKPECKIECLISDPVFDRLRNK